MLFNYPSPSDTPTTITDCAMDADREQFVSESIEPVAGTADLAGMSRGEPGLPHRFVWRGETYEVASVAETWKSSTPSAGEMYLRRHWYRIMTVSGDRMTLYCERQSKNRNKPKARWWLYSITGRYSA